MLPVLGQVIVSAEGKGDVEMLATRGPGSQPALFSFGGFSTVVLFGNGSHNLGITKDGRSDQRQNVFGVLGGSAILQRTFFRGQNEARMERRQATTRSKATASASILAF